MGYHYLSIVLLEGFKYQASDGKGSVVHTLLVREFAAMAAPHLTLMHKFLYTWPKMAQKLPQSVYPYMGTRANFGQ